MTKVWVEVDKRKFSVVFDEAGEPLRIIERRLFYPGRPWECWSDKNYWHHKHHALGKAWTLPVRIVEAARVKRMEVGLQHVNKGLEGRA